MFGGKFRSWMEAHLGRPRKKQQKKDGAKATGAQSRAGGASDKSAPSPAGTRNGAESPTRLTDLPASSHLHRGPLTAESLDSISTCPTTGSERGGLRAHVNLSSPESAYSTGYSTDGTSPGASFPPEYYINLRSGTHYFHSLAPGLPPLPAGVPPPAPTGLPAGLPLNLPPGLPPLPPALQPALQSGPPVASLQPRLSWGWPTGLVQQAEPPRLSYLTPGRSRRQQHHQQQHQQMLLEQQQQHLQFLQHQHQHHQHQQLLQQHQFYQKHQQFLQSIPRTESSTEEDLVGKAQNRPNKSTSSSTISSHSAASSTARGGAGAGTGTGASAGGHHWQSECVSSPRARTRIRTNPWLPTSPAPTPTATPTPRMRNQQVPQAAQPVQSSRQGMGGCSSSMSLSSSSSYGSASDVSLKRRPVPGRTRARPQPLFQLNEESPSVEERPLPRAAPSPRRSPPRPTGAGIPSSGRASRTAMRVTGRPAPRIAPPGRSSSESSTSSASSRTANNGSPPVYSDNNEEDVTLNEMMGKFDESYVYEKETDILSDSDPTDCEDYGDDEQTEEDREDEMDFIDDGSMIEIRDESSRFMNRGHCTYYNLPQGRRPSSKRRVKKDSSVSRTPSERRKRRGAPRPRAPGPAPIPVPDDNLNRIVMQRLLLRAVEPNSAGTRSAGSTPLSTRRHELRIQQALTDADREADRKYRQLIMQAENILVSMTGSPLPIRTPHYGTPPMSKRLPINHLNRRLDYLKQGSSSTGKQVFPTNKSDILESRRPLCPSPLARRDSDRDRNCTDNYEENRNRWSPAVMPRRALESQECRSHSRTACLSPSPSPSPVPASPSRTPANDQSTQSPFVQRKTALEGNTSFGSPLSTPGMRRRGPPPVPPPRTTTAPKAAVPTREVEPIKDTDKKIKSFQLNLKSIPPKGWTAIEASSSESDGDVTLHPPSRRAKSTATTPTSARPPLVTFKSVDLRALDVCPQSEPVKRKVYAGSSTLERLSKKLEHTQIMPGTPTTPVDDEDQRRRHVLMKTLQQLKQDLEDQSASLSGQMLGN